MLHGLLSKDLCRNKLITYTFCLGRLQAFLTRGLTKRHDDPFNCIITYTIGWCKVLQWHCIFFVLCLVNLEITKELAEMDTG